VSLAHGRTVKVHEAAAMTMTSSDHVTADLHPGKNCVTYEARMLKALLLQVT